jgi:hypothetical protein
MGILTLPYSLFYQLESGKKYSLPQNDPLRRTVDGPSPLDQQLRNIHNRYVPSVKRPHYLSNPIFGLPYVVSQAPHINFRQRQHRRHTRHYMRLRILYRQARKPDRGLVRVNL